MDLYADEMDPGALGARLAQLNAAAQAQAHLRAVAEDLAQQETLRRATSVVDGVPSWRQGQGGSRGAATEDAAAREAVKQAPMFNNYFHLADASQKDYFTAPRTHSPPSLSSLQLYSRRRAKPGSNSSSSSPPH